MWCINSDNRNKTKGKYVLLTNFNKDRIEIYRKSIEIYEKLNHSKYKLHIMDSWQGYTDYGLWYSKKSKTHDLAYFWDIFDEVEKKYENTPKHIFINGHKYIICN